MSTEDVLRIRALALPAVALLVAACGHGVATGRSASGAGGAESRSRGAGHGQKTELSADEEASLPATGSWDWVLRSTDGAGNLRVEQEEWHLAQRGQVIEGDYDRALTVLSTDDRLFACNQQLGYTRFTHVRVAGMIECGRGEHCRVIIRELSFDARPGPCDDGARTLATYEGETGATTMRLRFTSGVGQETLYRRQTAGGRRLAELVDLVGPADKPGQIARAAVGDEAPSPVSGAWEWLLKSIDADGDERVEEEDWHLVERDGAITGYYERTVRRTRTGAVFSCNRASTFVTSTRYAIEGHRLGEAVTLTEVSYEAVRDPCDNGLRRLDTYHGSVSRSGDELILSWGAGNQILRRQRPLVSSAVLR